MSPPPSVDLKETPCSRGPVSLGGAGVDMARGHSYLVRPLVLAQSLHLRAVSTAAPCPGPRHIWAPLVPFLLGACRGSGCHPRSGRHGAHMDRVRASGGRVDQSCPFSQRSDRQGTHSVCLSVSHTGALGQALGLLDGEARVAHWPPGLRQVGGSINQSQKPTRERLASS